MSWLGVSGFCGGFQVSSCRRGSVSGLAGLLSMAIFVYMTPFEATPAQAFSLCEASSFG